MDVSIRSAGAYVFGSFRLDPIRRRLARDGETVALTPTVLDALIYLVEHPGRIVTKEELLEAIWPGRVVEEANIKQTIFTLRRALGEDGERMISTAPGRGYRFAEPVERVGAVPPITSAAPVEVAAPPRVGWPRGAVVGGATAACALLAMGGAIAWRLYARPVDKPGATLVLADFVNKTQDPIFDRALANVLRVDLSQSPYVNVLSERQAQDTLGQMGRARDAALAPAVAEEVCARTNSDEVLDGGIAPIGSHYLLTLEATDCSGRPAVAEEKAEVARREDVIGSLDRLLTGMRRKLGEPRKSVDRFNVPLMPVRSTSLEAVKAYSEGVWLKDHGEEEKAVATLQRAVEIDPQFGAAYLPLAALYNNQGVFPRAEQAAIRAHALRDQLNERQRITEEVYYSRLHTGDYPAAIGALEAGTAIYPSEWYFWAMLANLQLQLAEFDGAEAAAQHAVALSPPSDLAYLMLASVEVQRGDLKAARKACDLAISRGLATSSIHASLLDQAVLAKDARGVHAQLAWAATRPSDASMLIIQGRLAYRGGRFREGDAIFQRLATLVGGRPESDENLGFRARLLDEAGLPDQAHALIAQAKGLDENADFITALAQTGDPARAERLVRENLAHNPENTMNRIDLAPIARSLLALRADKPEASMAALGPALPYQARGYTISFLLGRTYFEAGDGRRAAAAFQTILDHPGRFPESPYYSMAHLWLARSLLLQQKLPEARAAYRQFFDDWKDADPLPLLKEAHAEYDSGKLPAALTHRAA